ncbi:MAG TPA: acetolactate synthase 2 catalytic subunit [Rhodanobacteraceae bacterium]|nr:acetolactate synthase 2 catalytic subunit [Rhodanobacteraceae bacterium]
MADSGRIETSIRSGAQWLVAALEAEGVDTIFGYPGGAIMPVYDALVDSALRHILVRHEQAAALAADGYARASGRIGVCLATSGPGATNLLTGIANAYLDSVPLLAITGQVASGLMGTDAFQEVDIFGMSLPVVKHSFIVRRTEDVAAVVHEACAIARSGRPGPVLIDLPKDVAQSRAAARPAQRHRAPAPVMPDAAALATAVALLARSERPLLYIGGGVGIACAEAALRDFVARTGMPSVCTLKALGAVDAASPHNLGMLGMHGSQAANHAVQSCDLLLVVGARFDDRATGKLDTFAPGARVIHIDADAAEIGKLRAVDIGLAGALALALAALAQPLHIDPWRKHCAVLHELYRSRYDAPGDAIYAPALLRDLSIAAGAQALVSCDVGQHQMWVAQHWCIHAPNAHLTSGGLGPMGYGLPAALGAQLARPEAHVICVTGDGSIMMNIQELATLRRYGIPVKIVLLDNGCLGMVRQWQELFFEQRYSEVDLSDNPDFVALAQAFGIEAFGIDARAQVPGAIRRLLDARGPILCHVRIDPRANVWPLVPPGKSNGEMMGGAA